MLKRQMIRFIKPLFRNFGEISKIKMSALSPTMESGTIFDWHVKEGDIVKEEQELASIETDKAKVKLCSTVDGYVAKILYPIGSSGIKIGDVIAYVVEDKNDIAKIDSIIEKESPKQNINVSEASPKKEGPKIIPQSKKSAKVYPSHSVIKMPSLSPTKSGGKIVELNLKVGEFIPEDHLIAKIETDKSTMDFKAKEPGYVAKIFGAVLGEEVEGNIPLFVLADDSKDLSAFSDFSIEGTIAAAVSNSSPDIVKKEAKSNNLMQLDISDVNQELFISPRAKRLLNDNKIEAKNMTIKGSGPNSRIITQNVEEHLKSIQEVKSGTLKGEAKTSQKVTQEISSHFEEINPTNIRKIIAKRLTESKQKIPHYYLESEVEMGNLLSFKKKIFDEAQKKISVNDFIIKACALASQDVPEANSQWFEDKIRKYASSDISFAVDAPGGLITPIVKSAHTKTLSQINSDVNNLIEKAKKGELQPDEYMVRLKGRNI